MERLCTMSSLVQLAAVGYHAQAVLAAASVCCVGPHSRACMPTLHLCSAANRQPTADQASVLSTLCYPVS